MEELQMCGGTRNLKKQHEEQFVRWFEGKVREQYARGDVSAEMFALAKWTDNRARILHRCHINSWLFRAVDIEKNLVTQNSGVLVKGDPASIGNMCWYGVIKRMISLEFLGQKEVILFGCDWYDVPAASTSRGRGYNKDQFGVIDIDTTQNRYDNEPYIIARQAQLVFYVDVVNKPGWRSVIAIKPRDLFAMPELELEDSIDADKRINDLLRGQEDLTTS